MAKTETIEILNVLQPGKTYSVNREKHDVMKTAVMRVLSNKAPGMTVEELGKAVLPHLPKALFPGGRTSGWWLKAVQLDQEARGTIKRETTKPLRLSHATEDICKHARR
jgi:hypothetical protein